MENVFYVIQHFVYTCWQAKDYEKLLSKLLFKRNLIFFCKEENFFKYKHYAPLCLRMAVIMKISHVTQPSHIRLLEKKHIENLII